MQCVICMDADPVNERGKRPGIEAAWRLYDLLTARKIAAVIVDQSDWADDEYNDCNDILKAGGAEELKARPRKGEEYAIPGKPTKHERSEEQTSEHKSIMRLWYAGFCFTKRRMTTSQYIK